ncbi:MAG: hypothetical protein K9N46_02175 [Candidatus Marinimicrobia bacterium]|nr:hypothetical protein [Candidatus Neomarinimicrobiota bacterium]MCF7828295.1 hypothetical protein [Candidatus Neomarinimicrobiota bacterium]MCF7879530.1 hypothetical protein [Candidatus Neomarinimicrobiota bacterium]
MVQIIRPVHPWKILVSVSLILITLLFFQVISAKTPTNSTDIPRLDLHVHLSDSLSIENAVNLSRSKDVQFGIVEHPGTCPYCPIQNDEGLRKYISHLRNFPVLVGIQPVVPGWRDLFSPELLEELDYIIMDAMEIPQEDGSILRIWLEDTQVEDFDSFMEMYVDYYIRILNEEGIDILANATFLPKCLEDRYTEAWTPDRMQRIIDAAVANDVAIEINSYYKIPNREFIQRAKAHGARFSLGTNSRNNYAGTIEYALSMVKTCNLEHSDFFIPEAKD